MWEPPAQKQQPNVVWMERGAQHGNQAVYISVAGGRAGVCRYMSAGQEGVGTTEAQWTGLGQLLLVLATTVADSRHAI